MRHYCVCCGLAPGDGFHPLCPACGGMVEVGYDLSRVRLRDSPNPYVRFADLLPLARKSDRLPRDAVYTPLIHARRLGAQLGMPRLYLKNETCLPTGSTKDRMATVALAYLRERGVTRFCISSTGNSSTAYARAIAAHPDMHLDLFTAQEFLPRVQHADHAQVTHFVLQGASFVEACDFARTYARRHGLISERGFFNPGRREGLKLALLEACEQVPRAIGWYVQAVSSAMGVYGAYKGAKELHGLGRIDCPPKLLCVQQATCAPMAQAYGQGAERIAPQHVVPRPTGIAKAILRGDPTHSYPYVREIVRQSGGAITSVEEGEIRAARAMVQALEGVSICFSAATAVAGLIRGVGNGAVPRGDTVLVNLTGRDRASASVSRSVRWLQRGADGWVTQATSAAGQGRSV